MLSGTCTPFIHVHRLLFFFSSSCSLHARHRFAKKKNGQFSSNVPAVVETVDQYALFNRMLATNGRAVLRTMMSNHCSDRNDCSSVRYLRDFVEDADQNLKFLGLLGMEKLLESHPDHVRQHSAIIMSCLSDIDVTIKMQVRTRTGYNPTVLSVRVRPRCII